TGRFPGPESEDHRSGRHRAGRRPAAMNPATYESLVLPTGYRLAVASLPQSECASFSIHVPAGSRDDAPGLAGTAHFVEHMVFKGTSRRDARAISLEIEDAGGSLNACTTEDQVV